MPAFALKDPKRIGVAVLGAGRMAQTHMRTLAGIDAVHVVVVADPVEAAARRGAEVAHADRWSLDPFDAISDPAVEVVVVVTPTSLHAAHIEAALRAGKAVWTEKPIAQEIGDTQKIVDLRRETGLPCAVGFMRRYDPGYARAKELIDAGELGRIESFHAYSRDVNPPPLEFLLHAGGSFLDMSVHDLDLARFLVGEVEEVHAWAGTLFDDRFTQANDWDTAAIMLRFKNGAYGVIETARHSTWGYDIRAEVCGAKNKVTIDAGELGRIEQFHAYSRDVNPPPLEFLLHAGGSFLDMSVHDLDLARFLVGEVEEVHAWAATLFDDRFTQANDWDTAAIMLRFRNGAMGVIETARHSTWGYDIRAEVCGSVAKVTVDAGRKTPANIARRVSEEHDLYGDFFDRFEVAYRRELEVFFEDLVAGRTPLPGPDDALETLRLAVACTRSWRENRPVKLAEVTA